MDENERRDLLRESLASLLEQAHSTDPDYALTGESALSLDVSGKYVDVLFSTGGPHTEITVEYADADEAGYWFEYEPVGGWFTRMDWGTRDDVWVGQEDATTIMRAVARTPDELDEDGDA